MIKKLIRKLFIASLSKSEKTHLIICARRLEYPFTDEMIFNKNIYNFVLSEQAELALDSMIDHLYLDKCNN